MLRVALRPRFLGLLVLMVAATLACGLLATWQWDRAHRAIVQERAAPADAVALQSLLALDQPVTNEAAGRIVTVRGTFLPEEQVLVPNRSIDGTDAVIVVTALEVPQADGTTARLAVARGWMPAARVLGRDGRPDATRVPAPPAGEVELTGHLEASEVAASGMAHGTIAELSTQLLVNEWGAPMYSAYLAETSPVPGLRPMPLASSDFSRGLNWQNVGYAAQWLVFGGFFLYLWWRSVRAAHADEVAAAQEAAQQRDMAGRDMADRDMAEHGGEPEHVGAPHTKEDGTGAHTPTAG